MTDSFAGFPREGLQFFADIRENNNRAWFAAHKQQYLDHIVEPAKAFILTVGEQLSSISPGIQYDTRTNGAGSMMRIYRDVRFSKDKSPYKTWLGIVFWEGQGKKTENPGFYFGLDDTGAGIHVGLHGFAKPMLSAFRQAVADETLGRELEESLAAVRQAGSYEICEPHYKRVPRGFDADHPRADLLRYNGLYASSPHVELAQVASPKLVEIFLTHARNMAPLHHWLVRVNR